MLRFDQLFDQTSTLRSKGIFFLHQLLKAQSSFPLKWKHNKVINSQSSLPHDLNLEFLLSCSSSNQLLYTFQTNLLFCDLIISLLPPEFTEGLPTMEPHPLPGPIPASHPSLAPHHQLTRLLTNIFRELSQSVFSHSDILEMTVLEFTLPKHVNSKHFYSQNFYIICKQKGKCNLRSSEDVWITLFLD